MENIAALDANTIHTAIGTAIKEAEADGVVIDSPPTSFYSGLEEKEKTVLKKYKEVVSAMTKADQFEVLGIPAKDHVPPIDRDVEKLVIDLSVIVFRHMQSKMEADPKIRVEAIRSTVMAALTRTATAFSATADDKGGG